MKKPKKQLMSENDEPTELEKQYIRAAEVTQLRTPCVLFTDKFAADARKYLNGRKKRCEEI